MRCENGLESTTESLSGVCKALRQDPNFKSDATIRGLKSRAKVFDAMLRLSVENDIDLMVGVGGQLFFDDASLEPAAQQTSQR